MHHDEGDDRARNGKEGWFDRDLKSIFSGTIMQIHRLPGEEPLLGDLMQISSEQEGLWSRGRPWCLAAGTQWGRPFTQAQTFWMNREKPVGRGFQSLSGHVWFV